MKNYKHALAVMAIAFTYFLTATTTYAATTPSLGAAASYGLLSTTYVDPVTATPSTINGDVGFTIAPAQVPGGAQTNYGAGAPYATAGVNQGTALTALNAGANAACDFTFPAGAVNLATEATHVPLWGSVLGEYYPGVYCTAAASAASIGTAGIQLNGAGTYIFRIDGAFTTVDDSDVRLLGGASACDVFFDPAAATTIGAYTGALPNVTKLFRGTIIDDSGITLGANSSLLGRALAFASAVTLGDNATINVPVGCAAAPSGGAGIREGTITVVKTVINDNGRTKKVADFPLFVDGVAVVSGETNFFRAPASAYTVTETTDPNYTRTFSGDCSAQGLVGISPGEAAVCIITNNDIGAPVVVPPVPPLIEVVKVPAPLSLPGGPGVVKYTYTLTNIGTVPVTDVTMVGDTCSPIALVSGDTNSDNKLDLNEAWVHTCSTRLTETHTNTVVATGWANGISAIDVASATVVVGQPLVPPLIHVTKHPNPLTLTAGGGWVTYTNKVTNPGTVPLSNVRLSDDRCDPVKFVSGDRNNDSKLDPTETWTYSCRSNLTATTTNTVVARGEANGFVVRDFAVATVVVATAVPKLPNTGFAPMDSVLVWPAIASGFLAISILVYLLRKKQIL